MKFFGVILAVALGAASAFVPTTRMARSTVAVQAEVSLVAGAHRGA